MSAGRYEIAEGYLRRASEAAQAAGDLSAEARAVTDLGRVIASAGRPSEAVAELAAALDRFAALAGGPEVVRLHAALARGHMLKGDFSDAIEWADQALPHAERLDLVFEIADLLITRATALTSWGRVREGLAELQGSLLLAESYGLAWLATRARVNLIGTLALEDPEAALRLGQAGMEDARRTGARDMIATIAVNVAGVAMTQGRFDLAGSVLEEVLASDPDPSDRFVAESVIVIHRAILGEPYQAMLDDLSAYAASRSEAGDDAQVDVARSWADLITGRFAEANEASMRSVAVKGMSDSEVLPVAARAALWGGLPDKARQAKSTLQESGSHGRTIDAWERGITAGMAAQDGRLDEAADAYRDVIRQLRDLGSRFELALTELDFVRFVGGERPEVLAAAEEARAIFTEIGAKPLLRRLDETLGIPVD